MKNLARDDVEAVGDRNTLIVRVDESLYFGNALHVERSIGEALQDNPKVSMLLLDLKSMDSIDFTALESLDSLIGRLEDQSIAVRLVATQELVWEELDAFGIVERCGGASSNFATEGAALDAMEKA